jgi:hypothetical protein
MAQKAGPPERNKSKTYDGSEYDGPTKAPQNLTKINWIPDDTAVESIGFEFDFLVWPGEWFYRRGLSRCPRLLDHAFPGGCDEQRPSQTARGKISDGVRVSALSSILSGPPNFRPAHRGSHLGQRDKPLIVSDGMQKFNQGQRLRHRRASAIRRSRNVVEAEKAGQG